MHQSKMIPTSFLVVAIVGALTVAVGAALPTRRQTLDFVVEPYESIQELGANSDLIVRGHVGPVIARETDRGGDPEIHLESGEKIPGIPTAFVQFNTSDVMVGQLARPSITIATLDDAAVVSPDASPLREGQEVVLFLKARELCDGPRDYRPCRVLRAAGGRRWCL